MALSGDSPHTPANQASTSAEVMEQDAREGRTRPPLPEAPLWAVPDPLPAERAALLVLPELLPDPYRVVPNEAWEDLLHDNATQLCVLEDCEASDDIRTIPCRVHYLQVREHMTQRYEEQSSAKEGV